MSQKLRKGLIEIKEKQKTDSLTVLDIQKSLQFQMDKGLRKKMQQVALKSMFID